MCVHLGTMGLMPMHFQMGITSLCGIVPTDTGEVVAPGEAGNMVNTCLFKDDIFPIIRFNTNDVTHEVVGSSPMGLPFRRIIGFKGRSDNMVKLRGINVYPTSVGVILGGEVAAACR